MLYALIKNNSVSVYPYSVSEFRKENPNVSLPETPTEQQLNEVDIYIVQPTQKPQYNTITQNCTESTPENIDGVWTQSWTVSDASQYEIEQRQVAAKEANKQLASQKLTETDWTTIPDVSDPTKSDPYLSNVNEFILYRNQVRAIALNPPVTVNTWPVLPQEVWTPVPQPEPVVEPIV